MKAMKIFDELKKTDIVSSIELTGFKKGPIAYGDPNECGPNECNCDCTGPIAVDCDCDCH